MRADEILSFAQANLESYAFSVFSNSYRCAVTLVDGTWLPNVLICEDSEYVEHALAQLEHGRQQDQSRHRSEAMEELKRLKNQLTAINSVSPYSVRDVGPSPNAVPYERIGTDLLFPYFSVNYRLTFGDGAQQNLTTHVGCQFLKLPKTYTVRDVSRIEPLDLSDQKFPSLDCTYFYCFVPALGKA